MKQTLRVNLINGRSYAVSNLKIHDNLMILTLVNPEPSGDHVTFDMAQIAGVVYNHQESEVENAATAQ